MQFVSIEEFHGLKIKSTTDLDNSIVAIIGRNGAGKTRLLQAIAAGKLHVIVNQEAIPRIHIRHLTMDQLQPMLMFDFNAVQHKSDLDYVMAQYSLHRGKFHVDPQKSIAAIGGNQPRMHRHGNANIGNQLLVHVVTAASEALGKGVNELDEQDVADFYLSAPMMNLGSLNVTATMLAYWEQLDKNDYHEYRNEKYGDKRAHWKPAEFVARFGPPPWDVFNDFLRSVLDGRYHIKTPTRENIASYEARLFRDDGKQIDPAWLSAGEKVLMWPCLSMYGFYRGGMANPPGLLLLDEPDAALHPQMIQKLHIAMNEMAKRFKTNIIFTTHSPTTIALLEDGPIYQVSENALIAVDKDAAVGELLVGVDRLSIHYTNQRQVYVESHHDADVFRTLLSLLKVWGETLSTYISLEFIPAAPKLAPSLVHQLLKKHAPAVDAQQADAFVQALNGQGNCAQVVGMVESLVQSGGQTVHGIIDWDCRNAPQKYVHVLGADLFYAIENAILNPLTLGLYLIHNYSDRLVLTDYGLTAGYDQIALYTSVEGWQSIADAVTRRVLQVDEVAHDVECQFLLGGRVWFDRRYVQRNGHELEALIRSHAAYPFLNGISKQSTLLMDVVRRGIQVCRGRSMPSTFVSLFRAIQFPA